MGLGRHVEATDELQKIAPQNSAHPDVLEILWDIHAKTRQWHICLDIAAAIILLDEQRPSGWTHYSLALHQLKRTQEAFDQLMPVAQRFPNEWTVPYALASFCAQLGRFSECQSWLRKAMGIDLEHVTRKAIADPNLNPLWASMIREKAARGSSVDPNSSDRVSCVGNQFLHAMPANR